MPELAIDRFSEACGARGPFLLDVRQLGARGGARWVFDQPFLRVGSGPGADLVLPGDRVAARHCYLQLIEGRTFFVDLGSRGGTLLDGVPCSSGWLSPAQVLRIGPHELRLAGEDRGGRVDRVSDAPLPLSARFGRRQPHLPGVTLEIVGAGGRIDRCRMDPVLVLAGRAPACSLRLMNPEVGEFHCALLRTPAGVWLIDLLARAGITVRGTRVGCARLDDGEDVRLGPYAFHLRYHDPVESTGSDSPALPSPRGTRRQQPRPEAAASALDDFGIRTARVPAVPAEFGQGWPAPLAPEGSWGGQAPLLLARMFDAFCREQMGLVREELGEIRRLVEEVHALRKGLTTPTPTALTGEAPGGPPPHDRRNGTVPPDASPPATPPGAPAERRPTPRTIEEVQAIFDAFVTRKDPNLWERFLGTVRGSIRDGGP